MPPNPPRGERALLVPSPSPVTLHYSPATTFLNENPGYLFQKTVVYAVFFSPAIQTQYEDLSA